MTERLELTDATLREWDATVLDVDADHARLRIERLMRSVMFMMGLILPGSIKLIKYMILFK